MRDIKTHIDIAASQQELWDIVMDFAAYPQWNPYIKFIDGELTPGANLNVTIAPAGSRPAHFAPQVQRVDPPRELCWRRKRVIAGMFDQEQLFRIEPGPDGTSRFVNRQRYSGLLAMVFWSDVRERARQGLELMNRALKIRAERSR